MHVDRLDHLVLIIRSIQATCDFYSRTLGLAVLTFGNDRKALRFGQQKINLHEAGNKFEPKALHPTPDQQICVSSQRCRWKRRSRTVCWIEVEATAETRRH